VERSGNGVASVYGILTVEFFPDAVPNSISAVVLTPASPASRMLGDSVKIAFNYTTSEAAGARIFFRPFTNGSLSPGYAAHGSPLYAFGAGTGTAYFTITTGSILVDSIRATMTNADQSSTLLTAFYPVNFTFGNPTAVRGNPYASAPAEITLSVDQRAAKRIGVTLGIPDETRGSVWLYTVSGRQVWTSGERVFPAGYQRLDAATEILSGTYVVRLETPGRTLSRQITVGE
jgi:hypothetical protein